MKLDAIYQNTRTNILMMKEMPTAADAYNILTQDHIHQEFSKGSNTDYQENVVVCRVEKRKFNDTNKRYKNKKPNSQLFCEHCKIPGHSIEKVLESSWISIKF